MINIRHQYLFLYFMVVSSIAPVLAQDVSGSSIVSRTLLSPDSQRMVERRVYDNGLGDIVQETLSYPGSSLPGITVRHEYDRWRRPTRVWLPVTTPDSALLSGPAVAALAQSQYSDAAPFSRTEYDGLGRLKSEKRVVGGLSEPELLRRYEYNYLNPSLQ